MTTPRKWHRDLALPNVGIFFRVLDPEPPPTGALPPEPEEVRLPKLSWWRRLFRRVPEPRAVALLSEKNH